MHSSNSMIEGAQVRVKKATNGLAEKILDSE